MTLAAPSISGGAAVPLVVLTAALLHAVWNALAHGMKDQLVGFALINISFSAAAVVGVWLTPIPAAAAWPFIVASGILEIIYQVLLLRAYQLGDFAQMYPLARGTSPLLVALWATVVLSQPIGRWQLLGVLIISVGLLSLALPNGWPHREQWPALAAAIGTGVMIASYTVVDGLGVRHSGTVFGYIAWIYLLQGPGFLLVAFGLRGRVLFSRLGRDVWISGLAGGLLSLSAYGLVVWAQAHGNLATVAALRETSIVIAALIGAVFLHDRLGRFRMAASAVVVLGIVLMELAHG